MEEAEGAVQSQGTEELYRGRRGTLSRLLDSWTNGIVGVSSPQPASLTASPVARSASSTSTSHGPWRTVGRTASPSPSVKGTIQAPLLQGSRLGQPSLLRSSLSASTSIASLAIGSQRTSLTASTSRGRLALGKRA